jgi:folate-dependent phosphoribosylglycinamide formyltransferase PurN
MNKQKKILVFNSGSGSGFQELVENSRTGILQADIIGLVTNNPNNGCLKRAEKLLGIEFMVMKDYRLIDYDWVLNVFHAEDEWIVLSGWLKLTKGLNPQKTINIHPGPLPYFGGSGMYGHHVHEAVIKAYKKREIQNSEVCMHFVTEEYDKGPVFFRYPVLIRNDDDANSLGARVNKIEHAWQSYVTNLVIQGEISWDGKNPTSLVVPKHMRRFL